MLPSKRKIPGGGHLAYCLRPGSGSSRPRARL